MLSRVADAVYWMGRYLERAENITRLLLVTDDFATETQGFAEDLAQTAWKDVLAILPSAELTRPVSAFAPLSLPYLQSFFVDGKNPYSVHYSLRKARENARAVREALTVEVFMSINETFRAVEAHGERRPDATGLRDALASTHKGLFGIIGAIESTFTRDEAWHFFKLGAALERIYRTALILRAKLPALTGGARPDQPLYYTQWRSLLRSVSSLENYRRARGAGMEGDLVVTVLPFTLAVGPRARVYRYVDWNDNVTHHFTITKFHDRIEVTATSLVETRPAPVALADLGPPAGAGEVPYPLLDYLAFDGPVRLTPALRAAHGALAVPRGAPLDEQVLAMGRALRGRFEYQKDVTRYDSTTEDFLKLGQGVCQDFAHLMLGWLRLSGIPCRYVSGYLHVDRRKREPSQSHAWVEFHAPSAGWVAFDPTHGRPVDERYVVVGHGRHYDDVPPNKGIYRGIAKESLKAEVVTEVVPGNIVSTLREEISHIDLPVFREIPARPPDRIVTNVADVGTQQQQ